MSNTILMVDHDDGLARQAGSFLNQNGFKVLVETSGERAVSTIQQEQPALVILDVLLPGLDGLSVCRSVRPGYHGPIMMVTTMHGEIDEVAALETGADDYLVKPVRPRVLLARVRVLLRRSYQRPQSESRDSVHETRQAPRSAREFGDLSINPRARSVRRNGRPVSLTSAEFDLLWLLGDNAGQVLSRNDLHRSLRGLDYDGLDRSIDLRVSRIRRKLEDDPRKPSLIKSVRGIGYLLAAPG